MSDLALLLAQSEGRTLDFKRDLSSLRAVLTTLVAFANTAGGTLIIGREDGGRLCGVPDIQGEEERLANAIADGIHPALLPDVEKARAKGADLLVVRVARWPGPFHLKALGPEQGVYVRLGSTNRRADPDVLEELRRAAGHLVFDQLPCAGAGIADLDLEAVQQALAAVGRTIDEGKLEGLGVLIRHGQYRVPSNGGMILFGRTAARQRFFPDAQV